MGIERFSYFLPPVQNTAPDGLLSLEEVWEFISGRKTLQISRKDTKTGHLSGIGSLQEVTQKVRNLPPEVYGDRKTGKVTYLPLVTFGGVFSQREGDSLQETSGLVCLDIDHLSSLEIPLRDLKDRLSQDREIGLRLLFTSPSGDGIKLVCKTSGEITDKESYRGEFQTLNGFVSRKYSIPIGSIGLDKGISDITRGCLLCLDPEAILRTWEDTFDPALHPLPPEETSRPGRTESSTSGRSSTPGGDFDSREWEEFEEGKLVPALFRMIDTVFPEMSFKWRGYTWESPYKLDGTPAKVHRREKSVITSEYPGLVYEQGEGAVPIIDLYMRKNNLSRGEARKALSRLCGLEEEERDLRRRYAQMKEKETYMDKDTNREGRPLQAVNNTPSQTPPEGNKETPEERFREYLETPDLRGIISKKKEGIKTGYRFGEYVNKEEYLTLSPGLTLVCGKSSHGKSRLLQNLALQIVEGTPQGEGDVLFFSFEEDRPEVILQFANLFTNIPGLSQYHTNNTEVLRDYFQTGTLNKATKNNRVKALPRLTGFQEIYYSGRLRIYYSPDLYSGDLCSLLRYLSSRIKVKAVFLDYVQAIYKEGYKKDRREELREICKELNKTSKDLDIPIVLSAQLNRETPSPTSMSGENIAESADITRYADTILCLWNSAFSNDVKNKETYLSSKEYNALQSRGFDLGTEGKLYCILSKNRGGTPNLDTVLDFVGETGSIPPQGEDIPRGLTPEEDNGGFFQA